MTAPRLAAVLLIPFLAGCGSSPTAMPGSAIAPSPADGATVPADFGGFSVDRPVGWTQWQPNQHSPMTGGPDAYLANVPLDPACVTAPGTNPRPPNSQGSACDWPLTSQPGGGVLVTLYDTGQVVGHTFGQGELLNVYGRPTRLTVERPGACGAIGAAETLDVRIPNNQGADPSLSNVGVMACLAGPDLVSNEALVRAFLASTGDAIAPDGGYLTRDASGDWVATSVSAQTEVRLPAGQRALSTGTHVISESASPSGGSTLFARGNDVGTGFTAIRFEDDITTVVQTYDHVYFTGSARDGLGDPGVWMIDFHDLKPVHVVERGPWPASLNGGVRTRQPLIMSRSGRTVISAACGSGRVTGPCVVDAIDTRTNQARRLPVDLPAAAWVASDTEVITRAPDGSIAAYSLADGHMMWTRSDGRFLDGYVTSEGATLVASIAEGSSSPTFVLAAVQAETGELTPRWSTPAGAEQVSLWPDLSDDLTAVIGHGPPLASAFADGTAARTADTIDVRTGTWRPGQISVRAP